MPGAQVIVLAMPAIRLAIAAERAVGTLIQPCGAAAAAAEPVASHR